MEVAMLTKEELDEFTDEFETEEREANITADAEDSIDDVEAQDDESPDETEETNAELSDGSNIWEGTSEEQRNEIQRLQSSLAQTQVERDQFQHAADSDRGRHKALAAKAQQLEEENSRLKSSSASKFDDVDEDDDNSYSTEELEELRGDLPEVSAIVDQKHRALEKKIAELQKKQEQQPVNRPAPVQPVAQQQQDDLRRQQQDQLAYNQAMAAVKTAHPDFDDIVSNPNYATWLSRSAPGVQQMASSVLANDAIALVSMFKATQKRTDNSKELESLVDIPRKGASKSALANENDFDSAFEHFGERLNAERSAY